MQRNLRGVLKSRFVYADADLGFEATTLKELVQARGDEWQEDKEFFEQYLYGKDNWPRSPVKGILKKEAGVPSSTEVLDPIQSLQYCFQKYQKQGSISVALSGGLDSQVIALAARDAGFQVQAFSLRSDIPGYCEWEKVSAFATRYKIDVVEVVTCREDMENVLRDFVAATECPIYNLHPVSKYIMAREMRHRGIDFIFSGDGADQILSGKNNCDLYFLTQICFRHFDVELITPFATPAVEEWVRRHGHMVDKSMLAEYARKLWKLKHLKKYPTYVPEMQTNCFEKTRQLLQEYLCAP